MATEKKNEKERSVEERLQALYQLQTHLSEIDRIRIVRGELPNEVKDLEDEIIMFQTRIQKHKDEIDNLKSFISQKNGEISDHKTKIARYEEQMDNVRNNREYAFLEKEKEYENLEVQLAEKNIGEAKTKIDNKLAEIKLAEESLADCTHNLEEKKNELDEIISETRQEEEKLMDKAKQLEGLVDKRTLAAFKRIRKNAHNGLGIVTVERQSCGGCFNRIPPQRQLEIKMHKKIIVCEYCGRIMIDRGLAGLPDENAQAPAPKTRSRSRKTEAPKNL